MQKLQTKSCFDLPPLTDMEKQQYREMLEKRLQDTNSGILTSASVKALVDWRNPQKALKDTPRNWSDIVWAWIAEKQAAGETAETIGRPMTGDGTDMAPFWELTATIKAGWSQPQGTQVTPAALHKMTTTMLVYQAICRVIRRDSGRGWEEEDEEVVLHEPIWMEVWSTEETWQRVKNQKDIANVKERFWECMATLMMLGKVEGHVTARGGKLELAPHWTVARSLLALESGQQEQEDEDMPLLEALPVEEAQCLALENGEQSESSDEEEWQRAAAQPPPAVTQIMLPSPGCTAGGTAPSSPMETMHSPLSKPEEPDSVPPKKRKRQGELCVRYQNQKRMKQVSKKWGTVQRWTAVGTYPKHQKKAQQQKHPPQTQKTRRRRTPKEVIWDIYAGSQTLGKLRRASNIVYVPFDIRPTVWSAIHKAWVENVEFNVMTESPQHTIAKLRQTLKQMGMAQQVVKLRWTWLSPCCRTFSRMDWINRKHGCFRNHNKQHKPPLKPRSTEKGRLAAVADTMVQRTLALWDHCMHLKRVHMGCSSQYVTQEMQRHGIFLDFSALHMAMENPVGALAVQRYIRNGCSRTGSR